MDDLRYSQAKRIFLEVCDLSSAERTQRLDAIGKENPKLREEVESLLAHHEPEPPTIETASANAPRVGSHGGGRGSGSRTPGSGGPGSQFPGDGGHKSGDHAIGPYRVIRELGRGGMGVVYLAERQDDQFRRHVAIKLLKRGMDSEDVLKRFDLERQVLAALNHPGIARLYDAGQTSDGRPFFVMEHVVGTSITDYCDVHRLHIDERLELFRKVCSAVHHAHQNLVVHRDLKPSNIVVSEDGQPKLLDFGIAKIINPDMSLVAGDPTAPELRVMTPEYASPEQVLGMPISTASDVYSLGVLLYELLSGHAPYRLKSRVREELERIICDEDPERPSTAISRVEELQTRSGTGTASSTRSITPDSVGRLRDSRPERLRRKLEGDIDNIVMKAMRKEPQRRYTSVQAFGDDIERHLKGMPVEARPDTVVYRFGKFVRRNKAGVAAAMVVAFAICGGATAAVVGWNRVEVANDELAGALEGESKARADAEASEAEAVAQRDRADRVAAQLVESARTFLEEIHGAIVRLDSSLEARGLLVATAHEYIEALREEVGENADLESTIALAYERIAQLHGGRRGQSLGDLRIAADYSNRALDIRKRLAEIDPANPEHRLALANSLQLRGDMAFEAAESGAAKGFYEQALGVLKDLEAKSGDDLGIRQQVLEAMNDQAKVFRRVGERDRALEIYSQVRDGRIEIAARRSTPKARRDLSVVHLRYGYQLAAMGRYADALAEYQRMLDLREALRKELREDDATARRDVGVARYYLAMLLLESGSADEALVEIREARRLNEEGRRLNPDDARLKRDTIDVLTLHARILLAQGDGHGASRELEEALSLAEQVTAVNEGDAAAHAANRRRLAEIHERFADVAAATGDLASACGRAEEARALLELLGRTDPDDAFARRDSARVQGKLAIWQAASSEPLDAYGLLERASAEYDEVLRVEPDVVELLDAHAKIHDRAAAVAAASSPSKAVQHASAALVLRRSLARNFDSFGDRRRAVAALVEAREALDLPGVDLANLRDAVDDDLRRLGAE